MNYLRRISFLFFLGFYMVHIAYAAYDGLFFLGFQLDRPAWHNNKQARYNVAAVLNIETIATLVAERPAYACFPALKREPVRYTPKVIMTMPKTIVLLHSDGVKSRLIAEQIEKAFASLGIEVVRDEVPMHGSSWRQALLAKNYDLFLMGYKELDQACFMQSLLCTGGPLNFMGYSNPEVDAAVQRYIKNNGFADLVAVNDLVMAELPIIPLYYIPTL